MDSASILIAVGTSTDNLNSSWVRYEWDSFFNDIISGIKPDGQVYSLISGFNTADLPRALRQTQAFDYERGGLESLSTFVMNALGMGATEERKAAEMAVMLLDIVQSAKLYEDHGDDTASRIIRKVIGIMGAISETYRGHVVKSVGDEIMCRFSSANDSVRAAKEIRRQLNAGIPGETVQIRFRVGVHYGPAVARSDGHISGDAVTVAARLTRVATGDEVTTSQETVSQLDPDLRDEFEAVDSTRVNGRDEQVIVYVNRLS